VNQQTGQTTSHRMGGVIIHA